MWGERFGDWAYNFCGYGPSFGHGPWFFGWILPLLFWGFVIYAVFAIIRSLLPGKRNHNEDSALRILRDRFASGEINEKEYNAQKTVLGKQ